MPKSKSKKTKKVKHNQTPSPASRRGLGLIVVGGLLMGFVAAYRIHQSYRLSFSANAAALPQVVTDQPKPISIRLPKYRVTLEVVPTTIIDGVWQIHEKAANHLDQSASPGEDGNIVIYGHNSAEVFGPLRWMSPGEEIALTNAAGETKTYIIDRIIETTPEDIDWVLPKDRETLTVYTCSGFLNSKRHIVVAYPAEVPDALPESIEE